MIEVNLFTIPAGDQNARAGRCIARSRFNKELLGTTVEEFVKEFLKDNLDKLSGGISSELTDVLNSTSTFSRKDMACVNYYLIRSGYLFTIFNVTDDEENAEGVPSGDLVEWNIIDKNFIQQDYPTCTKIIPSPDQDIVYVLETVGKQSGLFEDSKFPGLKNPFKDLFSNLERIKRLTGSINSTIVSKIYEILDQVNIDIFVAASED